MFLPRVRFLRVDMACVCPVFEQVALVHSQSPSGYQAVEVRMPTSTVHPSSTA